MPNGHRARVAAAGDVAVISRDLDKGSVSQRVYASLYRVARPALLRTGTAGAILVLTLHLYACCNAPMWALPEGYMTHRTGTSSPSTQYTSVAFPLSPAPHAL